MKGSHRLNSELKASDRTLGWIKRERDEKIRDWSTPIILNIFYWIGYLTLGNLSGITAAFTVFTFSVFGLVFDPLAMICIIGIWATMWQGMLLVTSPETRKGIIALVLANGASLLVCTYSILYFLNGSDQNFGSRLSKVDAFYFALGIFTTAGTGSISPLSQSARLLTSSQYTVDLIYVGGIIAIGLARFTAKSTS
jgi:hypothetical protein